jgi:hypothetical protein
MATGYGAHLAQLSAQRLRGLYEDDEPVAGIDVEWVMWCWDVATNATRAPAHVRWRPPLTAADLRCDEWDDRPRGPVPMSIRPGVTHPSPGLGSWRSTRASRRFSS